MDHGIVALLLDEGKWLTASLGLALSAAAALLYASRHAAGSSRNRTLAILCLLFGGTIGTMAFGHLLAVSLKLIFGTLEGPTLLFYLIGIALAIPSWWLIGHAWKLATSNQEPAARTAALNVWLVLTLLVMGLHNLPLAAPGLLNLGYQAFRGRAQRWVIVGLAALVYLGLLIGSLIFLASGQSFEQFRGIQ